MSKENVRYQVFRTTRVRHALKDDSCWIHRSKTENAGQQEASSSHDEESNLSPTRQKSYVLMTAKKFGMVDSSVSPPPPTTEVTPSEGDSINHSNGDVPMETASDTKPEAATQEHSQNGEAPPETNGETKEGNGEAAGDESNVEHSNGGVETPTDVHVEECVQLVPSAEEDTEAGSPAEPDEHQLASATVERIEERADTSADPSNAGHSESTVPAGANLVDPAAESSAVEASVESNGTADVHVAAAPIAEIKPEEDCLVQAELAKVEDSEDTGAQVSAPPEEEAAAQGLTLHEGESCDKTLSEQAAGEVIAAPAEFCVESLPEPVTVTDAVSGEEASVPASVDSVPDILESVSDLPSQPAVEITAEDEGPAEGATESVESAAEAVAESLPETPAVAEKTQEEEAAPDNAVQPVPDVVCEPPALPADETTAVDGSNSGPAEHTEGKVEAANEVVVELSTETPAVTETTLEEEAASQNAVQPVPDVVSEPPAPPAANDAAMDDGDTQAVTEEIVEAAAEAVAESSPETPAVAETTAEEEASLSAVQPVPVVSVPSEPAASETVACEGESAGQVEPLLKATTAEVECEVQPVGNDTTLEQTVESTPESEAICAAELDIEDALETAASEAEAIQDKVPDPAIKLTDALDVEPPATEAAPEPVDEPTTAPTEEPESHPQPADTSTSEVDEKPAEEADTTDTLNMLGIIEGICSFCNEKIGNIKITLNDPPVQCHPECLKCAICALTLGDLVNPMFLRGRTIQCGGCVAGAPRI